MSFSGGGRKNFRQASKCLFATSSFALRAVTTNVVPIPLCFAQKFTAMIHDDLAADRQSHPGAFISILSVQALKNERSFQSASRRIPTIILKVRRTKERDAPFVSSGRSPRRSLILICGFTPAVGTSRRFDQVLKKLPHVQRFSLDFWKRSYAYIGFSLGNTSFQV